LINIKGEPVLSLPLPLIPNSPSTAGHCTNSLHQDTVFLMDAAITRIPYHKDMGKKHSIRIL
jgi:hypothetical protein